MIQCLFVAAFSCRKPVNQPLEMTLERAVSLLSQENEDTLISAASFIRDECYGHDDVKKRVCLLVFTVLKSSKNRIYWWISIESKFCPHERCRKSEMSLLHLIFSGLNSNSLVVNECPLSMCCSFMSDAVSQLFTRMSRFTICMGLKSSCSSSTLTMRACSTLPLGLYAMSFTSPVRTRWR